MFCKRAGAALLFGSMMFTMVNAANVYAVVGNEDASESQTSSNNKEETKASGNLVGICNTNKALYGAGGILLGLATGAVAGYCSKKDSSNKGDDGNSSDNNANNDTYSETEKEKGSDNDQSEVGSKVSLLDFLGAISYLLNYAFGIGSDIKIYSKLNKEKLATVVVIHSIGVILFILYIFTVNVWSYFFYLQYSTIVFFLGEMVCYFLCPVAGLFLHVLNSYMVPKQLDWTSVITLNEKEERFLDQNPESLNQDPKSLNQDPKSSGQGIKLIDVAANRTILDEDEDEKEKNIITVMNNEEVSVKMLVDNLQGDLNEFYGEGKYKITLNKLSTNSL